MFALQSSNAERITNCGSFKTVTVQSVNVLSPGTFNCRPLNGTSILPIVDAGICAALHKNSICGIPT